MSSFPLIAMLAHHMGRPVAIMDTETTGLPNQGVCAVVEFGCLVIKPDGTHATIETLINPGIPIPPQATRIHGIRDEDVINAPILTQIAPVIQSIFAETIISGFNTRNFDVEVLRKDFERNQLDFRHPSEQLDVREVHAAIAKTRSGKLHEVAAKYEVTPDTAHRALGDVFTTAGILERMLFRHGADFVLGAHSRFDLRAADRSRVMVSSTDDASSVVRETQKERLTRLIQSHVDAKGAILPQHYAEIAAQAEAPISSVSFRVSELFSEGCLTRDHVEDRQAQIVINEHLHHVIDQVGSNDKLRPIKEALDLVAGINTDYVQLRIAMTDLKLEQASRHAAASSLSM